MIPQPLQIIAKREQMIPLFAGQLRCSDGRFFQTALHLGDLFQGVVPALLQLVMYLCAKFRTLLEEAELTEAAIEVLSKTYLGGEDILFADTRAALDAEMSGLRVTSQIYETLAEWLDLEPIMVGSFDPGHPMVDAKVNQIVHVSRAEALVCSSDRRKFIDALQRAFPVLVEGGM